MQIEKKIDQMMQFNELNPIRLTAADKGTSLRTRWFHAETGLERSLERLEIAIGESNGKSSTGDGKLVNEANELSANFGRIRLIRL